jgi:hypothetical protein
MGTSCMVGEKVVACEAKVVGAGSWVAASSLQQQSEDGRAAERCRAHTCMHGGRERYGL